MTTDARGPKRREGLGLRHQAGMAVLFDAEDREIAKLDATAAAVWELCDGQTEVEEIVRAVCTVWDVDPDIARDDLHAMLRMLRDAEALHWEEP